MQHRAHPSPPFARRRSFGAGAALLCTAALAHAQAYPSKPITIVVPFGAGSGTDQQARAWRRRSPRSTRCPVIVDNRAGASGFLAAQYVAKAAPDGYTMLLTTNTTHAANEHLFKKLPYDPVKDFTPVALLSKGHMLLLVNPSRRTSRGRPDRRAPEARQASTSAAAVRPAASPARCSSRWRASTW
jgi:tripartite-type tricarboxylate transporter receptor subunit TctC